jgi:Zn-dependent protease with chaperone function
MLEPAQFHLKEAAKALKVAPKVGLLARWELMFQALCVTAVAAFPVLLGLACLATTGILTSRAVIIMYRGDHWWLDLAIDLCIALTTAVLFVFFSKQLLGRRERSRTWLEVTPTEQTQLFEALRIICEKIKAPVPHRVRFDSSAKIYADYPSQFAALTRCRLLLHIGLAVPVGVNTPELVGIMAHELGFFSKGTGSFWTRLMRRVIEWQDSRDRTNNWTTWLYEAMLRGALILKPLYATFWLASHLVNVIIHASAILCHYLTAQSSRAAVFRYDAVAAKIVGAEVYAAALEHKAALSGVSQAVEGVLHVNPAPVRLPDSLPLLVKRLLSLSPAWAAPVINAHWVRDAPTTEERVNKIKQKNAPAMLEGSGPATGLFVAFHELARRATYFRYHNDWGLRVNSHRFVAVEEIVSDYRGALETINAVNQYLGGMAHPQRAFCGLAEERFGQRQVDLIRLELESCREELKTQNKHMIVTLNEWTSTWRLVQDLEMGYQLALTGMAVPMHQFAVRGSGPEAFQKEILLQRHVLESLEGVLRKNEEMMENRLACALELLWLEPMEALPEKLLEMRSVLPHWVLVYEALGSNLPMLRELISVFYPFQTLGASVAGQVDSASYLQGLSIQMQRVLELTSRVMVGLGPWSYPFATQEGKLNINLAHFLLPEASAKRLAEILLLCEKTTGECQEVLAHADEVCRIVVKMIDAYLELYHNAVGWVTKAADLSEWHFCPPKDLFAYSKHKIRAHHTGPLLGRSTNDPELDSNTVLAA